MNDRTKPSGMNTGMSTAGGSEPNDKGKDDDQGAKPEAFKLARGIKVTVLDWSRDVSNPVECPGTVLAVNKDGTIDVQVEPPAGIEPYVQTGLTEATGKHAPGQWAKPAA